MHRDYIYSIWKCRGEEHAISARNARFESCIFSKRVLRVLRYTLPHRRVTAQKSLSDYSRIRLVYCTTCVMQLRVRCFLSWLFKRFSQRIPLVDARVGFHKVTRISSKKMRHSRILLPCSLQIALSGICIADTSLHARQTMLGFPLNVQQVGFPTVRTSAHFAKVACRDALESSL